MASIAGYTPFQVFSDTEFLCLNISLLVKITIKICQAEVGMLWHGTKHNFKAQVSEHLWYINFRLYFTLQMAG